MRKINSRGHILIFIEFHKFTSAVFTIRNSPDGLSLLCRRRRSPLFPLLLNSIFSVLAHSLYVCVEEKPLKCVCHIETAMGIIIIVKMGKMKRRQSGERVRACFDESNNIAKCPYSCVLNSIRVCV